MAERTNAAPALVDALTSELGGPRTSHLLDRLDAVVPWKQLASHVLRLLEYRNCGAGRPAWPAITMLNCLLLAKWFNLSDPQLEECLQDRLSFRRFVGLSLTDRTPDETTFVKFRNRLREAKLHEKFFDTVIAHIEQQGLLVREGTLVDATIIAQSIGRKREDGTNSRDEDASFTSKHGRSHHGYKGHIAAARLPAVRGPLQLPLRRRWCSHHLCSEDLEVFRFLIISPIQPIVHQTTTTTASATTPAAKGCMFHSLTSQACSHIASPIKNVRTMTTQRFKVCPS